MEDREKGEPEGEREMQVDTVQAQTATPTRKRKKRKRQGIKRGEGRREPERWGCQNIRISIRVQTHGVRVRVQSVKCMKDMRKWWMTHVHPTPRYFNWLIILRQFI